MSGPVDTWGDWHNRDRAADEAAHAANSGPGGYVRVAEALAGPELARRPLPLLTYRTTVALVQTTTGNRPSYVGPFASEAEADRYRAEYVRRYGNNDVTWDTIDLYESNKAAFTR